MGTRILNGSKRNPNEINPNGINPNRVIETNVGGKGGSGPDLPPNTQSTEAPPKPDKMNWLQKLTQHAFVGKRLFAPVPQVDALLAQASQLAKKNPQKAGEILLDIVLNTTASHNNQNQHPGLNPTGEQQILAYTLLVQNNCPQKGAAYIGMMYGEGTFKSVDEIRVAAAQIEKLGEFHTMTKAAFLVEALYSLAVMDLASAVKLGVPPQNLVAAAIQLKQLVETLTMQEKASLPNTGMGGSAHRFTASTMQEGITAAATINEKIEFAALYAKIGYAVSAGYVSPCFEGNMQPIANDESLQWNFHEPKGYWARLLFDDLKVQTWTDVSQINLLCEKFADLGFDVEAMRADCLVLMIRNQNASLVQRELAMQKLSESSSKQYDIEVILAEVRQNYDNSCWDVIGLYLKSHPELKNGYQSQMYTNGWLTGQPRQEGVTRSWGQFIASMQSLGLMSDKSGATLVYFAIANNTTTADDAKAELIYMASLNPENDFAARYECCQELAALNGDLQFQALTHLALEIKDKRAKLSHTISEVRSLGQRNLEMRAELKQLLEEDHRLRELLQRIESANVLNS